MLQLSIHNLMKRYFNAKLSNDPIRIRECTTMSNEEMEILFQKVKHIEEYRNINCLIKPGINEFDYIVYVNHDSKIISIDTPAPSSDEVYVYVNKDSGKPFIYQGEISEESAEYAYNLRTSNEIVSLLSDVTERLKEAISSDDSLREYCEKLISASQN